MATDLENNKDLSIPVIEDKKFKTAAKKGVSITISLVMLGFSGWKDLEPGIYLKYLSRILYLSISLLFECLISSDFLPIY